MAKAKEVQHEGDVEETKEVTLSEVKDNVPAINDSAMDMLEEDSGMGRDFSAEDLTIPRIGIIQSLSPQRSQTKPEFIEGCIEGEIFDNVGKNLYNGEEGINVIPVLFRRILLEWHPRDSKKGLAKNHGSDFTAYDKAETDEKGRKWTEEGNLLQVTAEYYVFLIENNGNIKRAVLSMSGSALKQAKLWNSSIAQASAIDSNNDVIVSKKTGANIDAPIFYYVYNMKTVPISNDAGEWFRWEISNAQMEYKVEDGEEFSRALRAFDLPNGEQVYRDAKEFREQVDKEDVKVAGHEEEVAGVKENDSDPM